MAIPSMVIVTSGSGSFLGFPGWIMGSSDLHLSARHLMIQLHKLVVKLATRHAPRGILALDLKGSFDNVSHASMLQNLSKTRCGRKTFGYINDFLLNRTATTRIGEEKSDPVELGNRGTPQGSVLSPLLFNLALLPLPDMLKQIEGVDHAFYADDISLWTTQAGSDAWAEEALQRAATTVHEYAKSWTELRCPEIGATCAEDPGVSFHVCPYPAAAVTCPSFIVTSSPCG
ncbi:uncharacterized protein LOC119381910 [Rhipicephalus sanguineus]|uniref:uncharacterized protein LOC119381910 n=1 Tax=Rhipicephalus sanguineus TaxID=34632 RepID=UPI00189386AA|nr:uncharacterized protein LOC119381910 [Rhipicephalus sanguineus]